MKIYRVHADGTAFLYGAESFSEAIALDEENYRRHCEKMLGTGSEQIEPKVQKYREESVHRVTCLGFCSNWPEGSDEQPIQG